MTTPSAPAPDTEAPGLDPVRDTLIGLDDLPVAEHATAYAEVQQRLQGALAGLDHL